MDEERAAAPAAAGALRVGGEAAAEREGNRSAGFVHAGASGDGGPGLRPSRTSPARGEGFGARGRAAKDVDPEEVRELYELSGMPVAEIRARFGLSEGELRGMRLRGGWTARTGIAEPGPLSERSRPLGRESHQYRLNRLLTVGVAMLETKVREGGMNEANARTLSELMRAQEISMRSRRNEKAAKAREKKNNDAARDFRDDPDWLIAEINRKIDRIAEAGDGRKTQRPAEADPEGAGG